MELFEFPDLKKPIEVSFTAPDLSSFGGLHLLHGVNLRQSFLMRLASHILEWRNKDLIVHSLEEMLTQRVFQIAAGYEDADDCDALRHDKFIRSYKKVPTKIILDFDDSNSNTYGAQQLSLFSNYYSEYCYILFRGCEMSHATISTFREKVILTAVRIKEFKTKIKVEFVRDHPIRAMMRMALRKAS